MSWTINENSKTSTTEYFNANYSTTLVIAALSAAAVTTASIDVSGYSSGTISFVLSGNAGGGAGTAPPSGWDAGTTVEVNVLGGIDSNSFITSTLKIKAGDPHTTFYIEWDIPLQTSILQIRKNSATVAGDGVEITLDSIRMQTESSGGGASGVHSSSGSEVGPGGVTPEIQFNDGGIFGGANGALYDDSTEQIKLANGSIREPMLAFSDGLHPNGTYDTGIYRAAINAIGISCGNSAIVEIHQTPSGSFIKGLNVGQTTNICGIRRLSNPATNSWEDGHMGNSAQLVFTGSDFTDFNTRAINPVPFAVSKARIQGGYGLVAGAVAAGGPGDEFIAVKVIPKGFQISNAEVTVAAAAGPPPLPPPTVSVWNNTATIQLLIQDINNTTGGASPNPTSLGAAVVMTDWNADGLNTQYTPLGPNLEANPGNGTRALIVKIKVFSFQITFEDALVGVVVPIERV